MRAALAVTLALAGCTLSLPESQAGLATGLVPDAAGLQPAGSDLRIDFGRAQTGVIDAVTRLLGHGPADVATNPECGAGLVTAVRWDGEGLTLNFQNGALRGWVVDAPGLRAGEAGLSVGSPPPPLALEETSLGREFGQGGVFGLVDETGTIALLWAGTSCFFR